HPFHLTVPLSASIIGSSINHRRRRPMLQLRNSALLGALSFSLLCSQAQAGLLSDAEKNVTVMSEYGVLTTAMLRQTIGPDLGAVLSLSGSFSASSWTLGLSGTYAGQALSLSSNGTFNTGTGAGTYNSSGTYGAGTYSDSGS